MAAYMQPGSDVIDYETMCNTIASGLTTGRVHICKQDPNFMGEKNCIGGVIVSVLAMSAVDCGFEPPSAKLKTKM
jgi:hypothetical protein